MAVEKALWLLMLLVTGLLGSVIGTETQTGTSTRAAFVVEVSSSTGVTNANREPFGYLVSIEVLLEERGFVHVCTGSILSPSKVLTTGTCFEGLEDFLITEFRVVAGTDNLAGPGDQIRMITSYVIHPDFKGQDHGSDYDYAVVTIQGEFEFNYIVLPIPLAEEPLEIVATGELCWTAGWGLDPTLPDARHQLQKAPLELIDHQTCKDKYDGDGFKIHNRMVCALQLGQEPHQLDFASPLVCGGRYILLGSATFPMEGAPGIYPSFFASTSQGYQWIVTV